MGRRFKVCVVDDHVESATVLCEGLKLNNYDAVQVHCGLDGLAACEAGDIDLVLLDIVLPDVDGYEICRRLKSSDKTREIPVVFVSVKGETEDIRFGYSIGAADYITKPYNLPMVMVRVEAVLRGHAAPGRSANPEMDLRDSGYTDQLTGLRNKHYLLERLQEEVDKAHRYDYPVSCVVFDLDEVLAVDSDTGPVSDDDLLAEIAIALRTHTRTHDILARYDGTMFAAILPHTPLDDALGYCRKIVEDMDATTFSDPNFPTKARMSVGVVSCRNGGVRVAQEVLGEAMRNLFQAKQSPTGRVQGHRLSENA